MTDTHCTYTHTQSVSYPVFPLEVQGRSNYLLHIPTHPRHGWASASVILTEDKGQRLFYLAFPPPPSESHGQLPGPE